MNFGSRISGQFSFTYKVIQSKLKLAARNTCLIQHLGNSEPGIVPKTTHSNLAPDFIENSNWFFRKFPICHQFSLKTFADNKTYKEPYPLTKKIIEPDLEKKTKIEVPLTNIFNTNFELPSIIKQDQADPLTNVRIYTKTHITIIRRRKMRKHKWKKLQKRMKFVFAKIKRERELKKEMVFQGGLKNILKEAETFSAENYLKDKLEMLNWVPPVTRARGRLAPQWVIDQELEKERLEEVYKNRIAECIEKNKLLK